MPTPTLGYGQRGEAPIDAVNIYMRSAPWYQALIRSFGQQPNNVHLNDDQKQQVIRTAQANGIVVDEGHNGQEVDDSGNFQAKSHAVRNTLIVIGIAAATIATMGAAGVFAGGAAAAGAGAAGTGATVAGVEGGAYGIGAGTVAALGTGAMAAVPVTAATTAAISTAAATVGTTAAKAAAAKVAASGGAITAENILKYALPVAGNLVGGIIQAHAASSAQDAQQKYLEEALAYAKEYGDTSTYSRQQTAMDRELAASALAKADQRYGDYQGRIKGFIDNGQTSNDRMSALLGLAPRANVGSSAPSYSSRSSGEGSQGVPVSPEITARILREYQDLGVTPTGRGTGPSDSAYYADQDAATGGLTDANNNYWFGPTGRIATDLAKAGVKGSPPTPPPTTLPITTQPLTRAATVQMRAPDGSVQTVPADQVAHYTQRGATVLQGAA